MNKKMNENKDLLITGVQILDGSLQKPFEGEVLLSGEKILSVSRKGLHTYCNCRKLDGKGAFLAPGFIDTHTHSDMSLFAAPDASSSIMQGVTSIVTGNCGLSPFPVVTEEVREHLNILYSKYGQKILWKDFITYEKYLQQCFPAVNVLPLCGHNTLKGCVYSYDAKSTDSAEKRSLLASLLHKTLSQGAWGLSTGLLYMPGRTSSREELLSLMAVLKKFSLPYATHLRSEGDRLTEAVEEAILLASCGSGKLHISHLKTSLMRNWGKLPEVFQRIRDAANKGLYVTADRYPYTFSATSLSLVLPGEYEEMTDRKIQEKLAADPKECERLVSLLNTAPRDWAKVLLADTRYEEMKKYRGKSIAFIAEEFARTPGEIITEILKNDSTGAIGAFAGMSEENMRKILQKDFVCCGSDETSRPQEDSTGRSHPRGFGSFPEFFHLLRSMGFSPEEAVHRMTGLPAKIFSIPQRGLIRNGFYADLILFDPEKFHSKADFAHPHTFPEGIQKIFVNGVLYDFEAPLHKRKRNGKVLKNIPE
ncbi:MAG: amidohydrolase family protein [Lentisphaeria bacterium]|nr:amidohydrolase family protein [Lentisphaeria bacterium]